jgi:hypothetical protein
VTTQDVVVLEVQESWLEVSRFRAEEIQAGC